MKYKACGISKKSTNIKYIIVFIISLAIFIIDRISKNIAFNNRANLLQGKKIINNVLSLNYLENRGVSFGLYRGNEFVTIILPIIIVILLTIVIRTYFNHKCVVFGLGFIIGGFLGNIIDRLFLGFVIDMIYFDFLPIFVCNVADISIFVGVILIISCWISTMTKKE